MIGLFPGRSKKEKSNIKRGTLITEDRKHILTSKSGFFVKEAYKALRTNVNFALANTDGCKVILVTSAMQSEGKSLTSLNLAISFAQTGARVLIIDCDLRRPKLNRLLNVCSDTGLSNHLAEPKQLDDLPIKMEGYGIDLISSGDIPPNPSELLGSAKMQATLTALREKYDYIVIDSPPAGMVTDAVVLVPLCDGVLFVVKANQTERGAVNHAIEQLQYAKAKVLGFVFNGANSEFGSGYGKYRKYGGYGRRGKYGYPNSYDYGYTYESVGSAPAGEKR